MLDATYGNVREAIASARAGVPVTLEATTTLSVQDAFRHARTLLQDGGAAVELRVDGIWLHVDPAASDGR